MKVIFLLSAACLICSCQALPPKELSSNFNMSDYESHLKIGDFNISGQAFMRQNGGGVVTCAGNKVYLIPDSAYFNEVFDVLKTRRKPNSGENAADVQKLARIALCDAQGNFEFKNLSAANWLITTQIKWKVGRYGSEGGTLLKKLTTSDNKNIKIIISNADEI